MASILQTIIAHAFSWLKMLEFQIKFQAMTSTNDDPIHWHIYASPDLIVKLNVHFIVCVFYYSFL